MVYCSSNTLIVICKDSIGIFNAPLSIGLLVFSQDLAASHSKFIRFGQLCQKEGPGLRMPLLSQGEPDRNDLKVQV